MDKDFVVVKSVYNSKHRPESKFTRHGPKQKHDGFGFTNRN